MSATPTPPSAKACYTAIRRLATALAELALAADGRYVEKDTPNAPVRQETERTAANNLDFFLTTVQDPKYRRIKRFYAYSWRGDVRCLSPLSENRGCFDTGLVGLVNDRETNLPPLRPVYEVFKEFATP